jgi:hypothetical protein
MDPRRYIAIKLRKYIRSAIKINYRLLHRDLQMGSARIGIGGSSAPKNSTPTSAFDVQRAQHEIFRSKAARVGGLNSSEDSVAKRFPVKRLYGVRRL